MTTLQSLNKRRGRIRPHPPAIAQLGSPFPTSCGSDLIARGFGRSGGTTGGSFFLHLVDHFRRSRLRCNDIENVRDGS